MPSPSRFSGASTAQVTAPSGRDASGQQSTSAIHAIDHIRRMRGGAQSQLMGCSDGHRYVVKFQNNPQDRKILVNELLGTLLARLLDLPTATPAVVYVFDELINVTSELCVELPRSRMPFQPGPQFGSRYILDPRRHAAVDYFPDALISQVQNLRDFAGMLVFDKWTCNTDGRQVLFPRNGLNHKVVMIDQGFCFNAGEWNFPDAPLRGRYTRTCVYDHIHGIDDFEPWLSKLESQIDEHAIWECAAGIPAEWYGSDIDALSRLLDTLNRRRTRVRELLWSIQGCKDFLPMWACQRTFTEAD